MARNTTRQGAGFELTVMHHLAGCQGRDKPCLNQRHTTFTGFGYECLRSSGSRGRVDVVAIAPLKWYPLGGTGYETARPISLLIQCKITNPTIPPDERIGLMDLALRAGALPVVAHWAKDETTGLKRVHYRQLTGPGPKDWAPWAPGEDD